MELLAEFFVTALNMPGIFILMQILLFKECYKFLHLVPTHRDVKKSVHKKEFLCYFLVYLFHVFKAVAPSPVGLTMAVDLTRKLIP